MSQHPHDEFDDVPPYQSGEAGKHRAPAAAQTGTGGRGGLKWIGILAVVALLVGVVSWFVLPGLRDSGPEATDEPEETQETQETAEEQGDGGDGADGGEDDGDGADGDSQTEADDETAADGEDEDEDQGTAADQSSPVQVLNYQGPGGLENQVEDELEAMGYNVTYVDEWVWGEVDTPVVYYPSGTEDHAQDVAENLGIDDVVEDDANWSYVAVVVGSESAD